MFGPLLNYVIYKLDVIFTDHKQIEIDRLSKQLDKCKIDKAKLLIDITKTIEDLKKIK